MFDTIYNDIATAKAGDRGERIRDGHYVLLVQNLLLKEIDTKNGRCKFFIAEFKVAEAAAEFDDVQPNPVGSNCSFSVNFDGPARQSAPRNTKEFVLALLGVREADTTPAELVETLKELTADAQPARGMRVRCDTYRKFAKTGENSKADSRGRPPMVMPKWQHID